VNGHASVAELGALLKDMLENGDLLAPMTQVFWTTI
jgi:hypothetical protein